MILAELYTEFRFACSLSLLHLSLPNHPFTASASTLQDSGVASGQREPGSLDTGQLQDAVELRENWDIRTGWLWVGKGLPGQ